MVVLWGFRFHIKIYRRNLRPLFLYLFLASLFLLVIIVFSKSKKMNVIKAQMKHELMKHELIINHRKRFEY